ncbi:hypothetical protein [Streptomyces lunaelactis]|uniref:hypothetical protein n=1 Tax=Streptomyces lunaelactis TaxID=1535768 RepID=UPI00158488AD|nr:hypothetical protein [Streptomyces lunaelactis]NUL14556.1 hypothetical protein [Streptomyces lunaelactis]
MSRYALGPLIDAEPARRHIRNLMAAGVSIVRIAEASGVNHAAISRTLYTIGGRPPSVRMRKQYVDQLLTVRAEDVATGSVAAIGSHRRIQALMAKGWTQLSLGSHIGCHPRYVTHLMRRAVVFGTTAAAVAAAYDQLWNRDPLQHGVPLGPSNWVRNYARKEGWAPPGAWDDETIDDPQAHPDWTGHCGTDRGYWMHRRQSLPMCDRCETAHAAWLAEHEHLGGQARNKRMFAARAAASTHEADIATDGRELMRVSGLSYDLAAERLGVTKQHLQQALIRHPEPATTAA